MKLFVIILALLMIISPVTAHRMYVDYRVSEIEVYAWYGGGDKIVDGDVKVYRSDGTLYVEGKTDKNGTFRFEPEIGESYKVVVESMGHSAECEVNLSSANIVIKEEPLYLKVISGLGYLLGLAGIASLYVARRKR
uniref:Carboxypeptidase regulatory-like domain-containing protein n=1 Tax=Geoglobus ahangari TaxID=113653 RepID=A0A7C3YNR1_9EURY